jgi:hypothetical protein
MQLNTKNTTDIQDRIATIRNLRIKREKNRKNSYLIIFYYLLKSKCLKKIIFLKNKIN